MPEPTIRVCPPCGVYFCRLAPGIIFSLGPKYVLGGGLAFSQHSMQHPRQNDIRSFIWGQGPTQIFERQPARGPRTVIGSLQPLRRTPGDRGHGAREETSSEAGLELSSPLFPSPLFPSPLFPSPLFPFPLFPFPLFPFALSPSPLFPSPPPPPPPPPVLGLGCVSQGHRRY